jgi:voltage-gated potassium channel
MREKVYNVIEIADPDDKASLLYDRFMVVCIIGSIIPLCFKQTNLFFYLLDKVTVGIFIIDYILRWTTADYRYRNLGSLAFAVYPFSLFAILDLLSILPSFMIFNSGFKALRLFRFNKALKALRLLRYSKSFNLILSVIKSERQALATVYVLAGGYIILSALIMFQVEPDSFGSFFDAIYWAVVTLTTVGYGDIYPISDMGRVVSMLSSFMGMAVVALPTGIISAGYMNELNNEKKENKKP